MLQMAELTSSLILPIDTSLIVFHIKGKTKLYKIVKRFFKGAKIWLELKFHYF